MAGEINLKNLLKKISEQRTELADQINYERKENECYGCYKYNNKKVRGEEMRIEDSKDSLIVSMKCPECEKEWKITINKKNSWKTRAQQYITNYKKISKERAKFIQKI